MTPSNDDIDFCKDKRNATKLRLAAVVGCGCYKNNYHNVFQACSYDPQKILTKEVHEFAD